MIRLMLVGAVVLAVAVMVAFAMLAYRRDWRWTGLPADPGDGTPGVPPRPAKTLWDWLQLLIVPLVLALAAFALNAAQSDRERKQDERRSRQERRVAADRAREETLRDYLRQISSLITDHGLGSSGSGRTTVATQQLATTLTQTALRRLDANRKTLVLRFLYASGLIDSTVAWIPFESGGLGRDIVRFPKVRLGGADLRNVEFSGAYLTSATGPGKHHRYEVTSADLSGADLRHADFRESFLHGVSLDAADLRGADFTGANISGASFDDACLSNARFVRVHALPPVKGASGVDFQHTYGRHLDFTGARLEHASFTEAVLSDVNLRGAKTAGADWPAGWHSNGLRLDRASADTWPDRCVGP